MTNAKSQKVLILGGVALGAGAAAKARRVDEKAEIIVIERGPYVSFANCGLPYYVGGVIKDRAKLLLHTPETLRQRFNIDVRILQEAVSIDRDQKIVTIRQVQTGETYEESYDKLVLATGAKPIVPPLKGIDLPGIFVMRDVPDVDAITQWIETKQVKQAVAIGAGFIGLEVVENLVARGINVTVVEKANQIMPPFDQEMTKLAMDELTAMGVTVILGDGITGFEGDAQASGVVLESQKVIPADLFIMGLGVRPDLTIAKACGLKIGETGALHVNQFLQTSDPDIYSGGDLADIIHTVHGRQRWIPLAAAANKQARIIGMNLFGAQREFHGAQGTSIVKVGEIVMAITGLSEKAAKADGLSYYVSYNIAGHHAGYYPGAKDMVIKLIVEKETGRLLGAELAGKDGVDKRIDVLATAIAASMTVSDLADLDLAYAPPFSSAKDPVILAGMAAENILHGEVTAIATVDELGEEGNWRILDVRRPDETEHGILPGATSIPLDDLRNRIDELDKNTTWVVYCRSGQRSYIASRILKGHGFEKVFNLSGGYYVQSMRG